MATKKVTEEAKTSAKTTTRKSTAPKVQKGGIIGTIKAAITKVTTPKKTAPKKKAVSPEQKIVDEALLKVKWEGVTTATRPLFQAALEKYSDAAIQKLLKAEPRFLCLVPNPTKGAIRAAFAKDSEWVKTAVFENAPVEVQLAIVEANPDLIRWIINPSLEALVLAYTKDETLLWVAGNEKDNVLKAVQMKEVKEAAKKKPASRAKKTTTKK